MLQHSKVYRFLSSLLLIMLVSSFVLTMTMFISPHSVQAVKTPPQPAGCPGVWYETYQWPCGSCGNSYYYYEKYRCQDDPCAGIEPRCQLIEYGCKIC